MLTGSASEFSSPSLGDQRARRLQQQHRMAATTARYAASVALLAPVLLVVFLLSQLPGMSIALPTFASPQTREEPLVTRRPAPAVPQAPPTLIPYTALPRTEPAAASAAAEPTAVPTPTRTTGRTYTVQPGDELKHIAANHGVSIWRIVETNNIPNPDSLRVGQVLSIPNN